MNEVTHLQGFFIWVKAFFAMRNIELAAEWMYKLNVYARKFNHTPIAEQIYSLKRYFILYLYENGYAATVSRRVQNRICNSCGGSGIYWTDEECSKCYGTGVYSSINLYFFRFTMKDQRSYIWCVPERLLGFMPVLTDNDLSDFKEPGAGAIELKTQNSAWFGCCVVWWTLFFRGTFAKNILFSAIATNVKYTVRNWFIDVRDRFVGQKDDFQDDLSDLPF